jgi:hypothetical protein
MGSKKRTIGAITAGAAVLVLTAALALPATAEARQEAVVGQTVPSQVVKPGGTVAITITVTNRGSEAIPDEKVTMFPTRTVSDGAVDNPYQSVSPSQGSCANDDVGAYRHESCTLGALPPGASVQIVAVLKMNVAMDHRVYIDNGEPSVIEVVVDLPTVVSGSKKVKLTGLPSGCGTADFTLKIKVKGARRITVFADLGFDQEGDGVIIQKSKKASSLKVKVPISRVEDPDPTKLRTLRISAQGNDGKLLKRTVKLANCTHLRNQSGVVYQPPAR